MSTDLSCAAPGDNLKTVVKSMAAKSQSCMLIVSAGLPIGIITERDIVKLLLRTTQQPDILQHAASEWMSSPVVTLPQQDSVFNALVVARAENVRHLPVVDDNSRLVGLVTRSDLTKAHLNTIEAHSALLEDAIKKRTLDLETTNKALQTLSLEDGLLGIGNRRAMEADLQHTHASAQRYENNYSVALLDVDYFKKYNDRYGHTAGDAALKSIANSIKANIRESDRVYRYGGEEFLILLPATGVDEALILLQRLVASLADLRIPHDSSPYAIVTASAGVACAFAAEHCMQSWREVAELADQALYRAKSADRNTVVAAA